MTNCSRAEAVQRLQVARMVRDVPAVGDALFDAHLGATQVRELARLHANGRVAAQFRAAADLLVEHACLLPYDDFRRVCQRFEAYAAPTAPTALHASSRLNRHLSITGERAGFTLRAEGDAVPAGRGDSARRPRDGR